MSEAEDRLMRYFDGELGVEEAAEVERALATSPEARALLGDFERVGVVVRTLAEEKGARGAHIADHVMARLESPAPKAPKKLAPASRGRVLPFVSKVGLALAAAAAMVFFVRSHPWRPVVRASESAATATPHAAGQLASVSVAEESIPVPSAAPSDELDAPGTAEPGSGASIEVVDFGAQNGTIFMVATGPQVTPVVWLMDGHARSSGRMKAL